MDGGTIGLVGGVLGGLIGLGGAFYGCRASYLAAGSEAERRFLRRLFVVGGLVMTVFLAVILSASFGLLPRWIYWVGMAVFFGLLPFAIVWTNRRLRHLGAGKDSPPERVDNPPAHR